MRFIARYMHRRHEAPEYYKTIFADTLNEAIKAAQRFTRKGYLCAGVTTNLTTRL